MTKTNSLTLLFLSHVLALMACGPAKGADRWLSYEGGAGPGQGKHIVLISGDEEYRSEEAMPMLGRILSQHHGFQCTVLFSLAEDGTVHPNNQENITGLESLASADLMIIFTRFRRPADEDMKHINDYLRAGKPVIGLRTATHAFAGLRGAYERYNNGHAGPEWKDGFGREIVGEQWISHHGAHGRESTRGIIAEEAKRHPIVLGIKGGEIWGPTDVYGVRLPLPGDCQPLVLGQVLRGMHKDDAPVSGLKNDPMMPVAWTKTYTIGDKTGRVFTTTMGASQDFVEPGLRRLVVNAVYWCLGMEREIDPDSNVEIVGDYRPTSFGFQRGEYWHQLGRRPADYSLDARASASAKNPGR
jgi:type 1 glutamine amidotransferase